MILLLSNLSTKSNFRSDGIEGAKSRNVNSLITSSSQKDLYGDRFLDKKYLSKIEIIALNHIRIQLA